MHARLPGAAFAIVACAAWFAACGDFKRNNPFDPDVPVAIRIVGPDTITSQLDTVRFSIASEPVFDPSQVRWNADPLVPLDSGGTYRVPLLDMFGREFTVTGHWGPRVVSKKVLIRLRPAALVPCPPQGAVIEALRSEWVVCFGLVDRRGAPIDFGSTTPPTPTFSIGNPSVLESFHTDLGSTFRIYIRSLAVGKTAVTVAANGMTLAVPVTVRQRARYFTVLPSCLDGLHIKVGQSIQLSLGMPIFDGNRHPLTDPADIQSAPTRFTWGLIRRGDSERARITSGGLLTGVKAGPQFGRDLVYAYQTDSYSGGEVAWCEVIVE